MESTSYFSGSNFFVVIWVVNILGFNTPQIEGCKFTFKNQSFGILAAPQEAENSNQSSTCSWDIEVQEGLRIAISIRSFFLNPGDTLTITELRTIANSTLMKRKVFDQKNKPQDVIFSSSNKIMVELNGDSNILSNYIFTDQEKPKRAIRKFYAIFEVENCGGLLTSDKGIIEVPLYIHLSMKSHECIWRIKAPDDKVISLSFLTFEVGPGSCLFNMLYIRDGLTSLSDLIGSFCEEYPPLGTIRSSGDGLTITYRARPTFLATKTDFLPRIKMVYEFDENCGGILESFSGSFTSPSSVPSIETPCIWSIKVPESNHALLTIKSFEMNVRNETGLQENLKLYDGRGPQDNLLWSSDWDKPPPNSLFSSKRELTVNYSTLDQASSTVRLKFKISFRAVHDRILYPNKCTTVGVETVFKCDENQYIYCENVCNGIQDCENGFDEDQCLLHYSQIGIRENDKKVEVGYLILSFALFGSAVIACMLVFAIDRICKSRISTLIKEEAANGPLNGSRGNGLPHSPSLLPPYSEADEGRDPPPCYEEAISDHSNIPLNRIEFNVSTGRGYCQSPLVQISRDNEPELIRTSISPDDLPER